MELRNPVEGALFAFDKGFKVFPLKTKSKIPAVDNWQEWAEKATRQQVERHGRANPTANWGVSCEPSGLFVVDLDTAKNGIQNFMEFFGGMPDTFTVITPTKGQHLYFLGEGRNTASAIAEGVDTRGKGGYVVAPGSRTETGNYEILNDVEIQPCPQEIYRKAATAREAKPLPKDAPIEQGKRNATLASLAGSMRKRGMIYDAILAALLETNEKQFAPPLPEEEVEQIARSIARYEPEAAEAAADFFLPDAPIALRASDIKPGSIPAREWIMRNRYISGFLTVTVAPGGVGKSTLALLDAVAVATGRNLTGFEVEKKGAVWVYNTEDPLDELKRRVMATAIHHSIPLSELSNVHMTSGRDNPLVLVKAKRDSIAVNKQALAAIIDYIKTNNIVLFMVDPFVRTHECEENNNAHIDKVAWCFQYISDATGCAVSVVHHTHKGAVKATGGDNDANAARGASALINAARIANVLSTMDEDEAKKFGVDPTKRRWYVRLDSAKANLQPPAEKANWYTKVSVELLNGDEVGTLEKVNIAERTYEQKTDQEIALCRELSMVLSGIMTLGDKISLSDIKDKVFTNKYYPALFKYNRHTSRQKDRKLIEILETGNVIGNGVRYDMVFMASMRNKHWVHCLPYVGSMEDVLG